MWVSARRVLIDTGKFSCDWTVNYLTLCRLIPNIVSKVSSIMPKDLFLKWCLELTENYEWKKGKILQGKIIHEKEWISMHNLIIMFTSRKEGQTAFSQIFQLATHLHLFYAFCRWNDENKELMKNIAKNKHKRCINILYQTYLNKNSYIPSVSTNQKWWKN